MISRHLANISGLLRRDQTLQHIEYLESRVKSPLQVLQRAAKCSADVANKAPGMSSEGMAAAKVQIFLFSFMAALRESNSELLIHFFSKLRCMCPPKEPENFSAVSVSPGSPPGLCSPFPVESSPSHQPAEFP